MAILLQAATLALAITSLCPPGYFKDGDLCTHCQPGTFNNATDASTKCTSCTPLCPNNYLIIKDNCTAAYDTICGCPDGTFDENFYVKNSTSLYSKCKDHSKCNAGYEVLHNGTGNEDTKCQACKPGTYSLESSLAPCQVCPKNCPYGLQKLRPCGGAHGIVCICPDGTHDTSEFRHNDNLKLDLLKHRVCKEHSNCPKDYVLVKKGSHQSDSLCEQCVYNVTCPGITINETDSDTPADENHYTHDDSYGFIVGVVITCVIFACVFVGTATHFWKRKRKHQQKISQGAKYTKVKAGTVDKITEQSTSLLMQHEKNMPENLWLSVRSLVTLSSELTMEEVKKICRLCLVSENSILDIEHSSKSINDKKVDLLIGLQTQHKEKRCSDNDILEAIKSIEKSQLFKRVSSAKEMNLHIN